MLKIDELLFERAKGQAGEAVEKAIQSLNNPPMDYRKEIWGLSLPPDMFLLEVERANAFVETLIKNYWGNVNLFVFVELEHTNVDEELFETRLQQFFSSSSGMTRLLQYIKRNNRMRYEHFLSVVFEKEVKVSGDASGLSEILFFTIKDKVMVQGIYSDDEHFWRLLYAKKMYSCLKRVKLALIEQPVGFMKIFKELLAVAYTHNRIASIIHKLVQELDYENPKSFELKQLHLLNIVNHYVSGRRSLIRLKKCVDRFVANWSHGNFEITEMEQTLLAYLLFMRATVLKLPDEQLEFALFLMEDERLNNHSVEILFEFGAALNLVRPQPESIVKNYANYYLEHVYYLMLNTLVERELFYEGYKLLKRVEIASCTAMYQVIQGDKSEEALAYIEATVQRDITTVMQMPASQMMEAIQSWQALYRKPKTIYAKTAIITTKHIMNILKILFVNEQLDGFEKLLEVYKKYLEIPSSSKMLHQFLVDHIEHRSERYQPI